MYISVTMDWEAKDDGERIFMSVNCVGKLDGHMQKNETPVTKTKQSKTQNGLNNWT